MTTAYVYRDDTHINVAAPYNRDFVESARRHGGRWDAARKLWRFSRSECNLGGIVQLCVACYQAVQEGLPPAQSAQQALPSAGHVGAVGAQIETRATITRAVDLGEGRFGPARLYVMHTAEGHMLVWRSTSALGAKALQRGEVVKLRGTVKQHDLYKGAAQTVLTRCKVLAQLPSGTCICCLDLNGHTEWCSTRKLGARPTIAQPIPDHVVPEESGEIESCDDPSLTLAEEVGF